MDISTKDLRINDEIHEKEVRLVGEDGSQLGIVSSEQAQKMADERELDLVMIAPQATPPVCKILDYGRYCYEQQKREKEAKKNQKTVDIKEVRFSMKIDTNDFNTKVKMANKFLAGGDKVKVSIRFRGREMAHTSKGFELLGRFAEACSELGNVEKEPKMEGRSMAMFISAKPAKQIREEKKNAENQDS